MPGWALAFLARYSGGGKTRVSCNRADSPCSLVWLMWPPRARPASASCLSEAGRAGRRSLRNASQLEPIEMERRNHGATEEGVTTERPGRLPHVRFDDDLRDVARGNVGSDDVHDSSPVRPLAGQLDRITGIEVPHLGGVDAVRGRLLALEEQVVDRAARR